MQEVRIEVLKPDLSCNGKFKTIYRNQLSFPTGVNIPFNALYDGLRLLYPAKDVYIQFLTLL